MLGNLLADIEVVVGLKKNGNISTCPQHQLVNSSRVPLYEPTHVIHLEEMHTSQGFLTVFQSISPFL